MNRTLDNAAGRDARASFRSSWAFALIVLVLVAEIAFVALALVGYDRLRSLGDLARQRDERWTETFNAANYVINSQGGTAAGHGSPLPVEKQHELVARLKQELNAAQVADVKFFAKAAKVVPSLYFRLVGEDASLKTLNQYRIHKDVVALLSDMAAAEPALQPAIVGGADTGALFSLISRRAVAPARQSQADLSAVLLRGVRVMAVIIVTASISSLLGIIAIWQFVMRPGLRALEAALGSQIRSEVQLREILGSIGEAVIATDHETRVIEMNREAERLTGWRDGEARNRLLNEVFPVVGHDWRGPFQMIAAPRTNKQQVKRLTGVKIKSRNNVEYSLAITMQPVYRDGMAAGGLVVAFRDISDELALKDMLIHREKARSIEALAGSVAHDFNNLLAVILGKASLMAGAANLDAGQESNLQSILRSSRAGAELAKRLLALSHPKSGKPEQLALDDVVSNLVAMTRLVLTGGRTVEIRNNCGLKVLADQAALKAAIINVIMNAIDATKDDGRITISFAKDARPPSGSVTIEICDDGCGIAPELLNEIRKPFFTTKGAINGSGLGLPSAVNFLRQTGGDLHIYSEIDVGTSVFLTLPTVDEAKEGVADGDGLPPEPAKRQLNILVLDDNQELADTIKDQIVVAGHRAVAVSRDNDPAFDLDRLILFDVVVCDVLLGQTTGFEVRRKLIGAHGAKCPPFLFITGNIPSWQLANLSASDNYRILLKPFDINELLSAAAEVLGQRPAIEPGPLDRLPETPVA